MSAQNGRLLSGIKPTGELHLGNFFGAIHQFIRLQNTCDNALLFVADYHALTTCHNPETLAAGTRTIAAAYLAAGADLEKVTIFRQSDIPEHTELAWIFNCITNMGYLERSHAYKSAKETGEEVSVGTFDYPMLMAADILLYDTDIVPVGSDQKQHIEFARDTAARFNHMFDEAFKLPEPVITEEEGAIPGTDGKKMSKSHGNTIPLFGSDEEIRKAVASIVTDSKEESEPKDTNDTLFTLLRLVTKPDERSDIEERYQEGGIGYKEAKDVLADKVIAFITPMREQFEKLCDDPTHIDAALEKGREQVQPIAKEKMQTVRSHVGVRGK